METIIGKLLYIYRKLREPSTQASLAAIMTSFAISIPDDKLKAIAGGATIIFGILGVLFDEKGPSTKVDGF